MNNAEIMIKCLNGIDDLHARQKVIVKEHSERTKRLRALLSSIQHATRSNQNEMLGIAGASLDPDLLSLLENPLAGL